MKNGAIIADRSEAHPGLVKSVRVLIWTYVFFLVFEGALRKWIVPGLSSPLLIVRDPIVILIYLLAAVAGVFPKSKFLVTLLGLTCMAIVFGLLADDFDPAVYAFGLRTNFLHLPLIFVIGAVMNYKHVVTLGRGVILLAIPMTVLVIKQFQAGSDDVLNTGAGGTGTQLETSGGKMRASGTFSFVAGVVCFYAVVAGFLLNSLMKKGTYPRWLQFVGLASVIAAVSTSGSRSAVAGVLMVAAMVIFVVFANPAMLGQVVLGAAMISLLTLGVMQLGVVGEGVDILSMRFEEAGGGSGIFPRLIDTFLTPFMGVTDTPLFGRGLGLGTNAGSAMATGHVQFLLAEGEWDRVIQESGPVFGLLYVGWRCGLLIYLFAYSIRSVKLGNFLPMLMFGASAMFILNGQFGQPTILGFAVLGGGLCVASGNEVLSDSIPPTLQTIVPRVNKRRSRSPYAEALHQKVKEK